MLMERYRNSRVFPIAIILIAVAVTIAALVSLARVLFFPAAPLNVSQADTARQELLNTSVTHSVKMFVREEITGAEDARSYEITASPERRTFVGYEGYTGKVIDSARLANSAAGYEQFVHALEKANMTRARQISESDNDTRGVCATGELYIFEIIDGTDTVQSLWTTTCSSTKGSLDANLKNLYELFVAQIPDGRDMIRGL